MPNDPTSAAAREIEQLRADNHRLRLGDMSRFDYERLVEWIGDPDRKPPNIAFTAGAARTAAWAVHESGVLATPAPPGDGGGVTEDGVPYEVEDWKSRLASEIQNEIRRDIRETCRRHFNNRHKYLVEHWASDKPAEGYYFGTHYIEKIIQRHLENLPLSALGIKPSAPQPAGEQP